MSVFKDRRDDTTKSLATGRPSEQHLQQRWPSNGKPVDIGMAQGYANLVGEIFRNNPFYDQAANQKIVDETHRIMGTVPDNASAQTAFTPDAENPEPTGADGDIHAETNEEYRTCPNCGNNTEVWLPNPGTGVHEPVTCTTPECED